MKKSFVTLLAFLTLTSGLLLAQSASLIQWTPAAKALEKNGVFSVAQKTSLQSIPIVIDPNKAYTLKGTMRTLNAKNNEKSLVFLSLIPIDEKGRDIYSWNVNAVPGTCTTVIENVSRGSKILKVKNAEKIEFRNHFCLVSGAKADFSDLPNRTMLCGPVVSKVKKDGYWELTLKSPLLRNLTAGEGIRQHRHGGYIYPAGSRYVRPEWSTASGTIKGLHTTGSWEYNHWPIGTKKAKVIILLNWDKKNLITEIKDITLTAK